MNTEQRIDAIRVMLDMQNAMNQRVHDEWFAQDFEWYRAIWIECGEMLEHFGWKWWKHQKPDVEQVKLELVDIFHFGLSSRIDGQTDFHDISRTMAEEMASPVTGAEFRITLEKLAATAVGEHRFDGAAFAGCLEQIGMSFEELYRSYVGKNTLNFFRQDHGYKDGTYIKIWHGREDNEHLVEIIAALDIASPSFRDDVYQALESNYPSA